MTDPLLEAASRIAADIAPDAARFERDEAIPADVFARLGSAGLMAVSLDPAFGGSGRPPRVYAQAMMQVARACAATAVTMSVTNMVGEVIAHFGDDAQRARHLPALARGGLGAFALSEAGAGSDPASMRTRATRDGDDYVIEGDKQWISHGDAAEVTIVWARTEGRGAKGLTCFLVAPTTPGYVVARHEDKLGLRASHTVALAFDRLRVPASARLGREGEGFAIAMWALDGGRIGIASQAIGIAEGALAVLCAHATTLPAEGRDAIVDARVELDAARALVLEAADARGRGERVSRVASMAKALATETAVRVATRATLFVDALPREAAEAVLRAARDVRVTMIYEGTSEVQRLVVARELRAP